MSVLVGSTFFKARYNEIVDQQGRQIAVVMPTNCTKKAAREMAAYAAQQMNHAVRAKNATALKAKIPSQALV